MALRGNAERGLHRLSLINHIFYRFILLEGWSLAHGNMIVILLDREEEFRLPQSGTCEINNNVGLLEPIHVNNVRLNLSDLEN